MSKKMLIALICVLAVLLVGELIYVGTLKGRDQADPQNQSGTVLPTGTNPDSGVSQEGTAASTDPSGDGAVTPTEDASTDPSGDGAVTPTEDPSTDPSGDPTVTPTEDPSTDPSGDPSTDPSAP